MELVFRDPPAGNQKGGSVQRFLAQLAEHPNRWAVLRENIPIANAHAYRCSYGKRYPTYEFLVARENPSDPKVATIYVRYVYNYGTEKPA